MRSLGVRGDLLHEIDPLATHQKSGVRRRSDGPGTIDSPWSLYNIVRIYEALSAPSLIPECVFYPFFDHQDFRCADRPYRSDPLLRWNIGVEQWVTCGTPDSSYISET